MDLRDVLDCFDCVGPSPITRPIPDRQVDAREIDPAPRTASELINDHRLFRIAGEVTRIESFLTVAFDEQFVHHMQSTADLLKRMFLLTRNSTAELRYSCNFATSCQGQSRRRLPLKTVAALHFLLGLSDKHHAESLLLAIFTPGHSLTEARFSLRAKIDAPFSGAADVAEEDRAHEAGDLSTPAVRSRFWHHYDIALPVVALWRHEREGLPLPADFPNLLHGDDWYA